MINLLTKFEVFIFTRYEDMKIDTKNVENGSLVIRVIH